MNKEFTTYEQSLALQELGFDEPCFRYYHTDKTLRSKSEGWFNETCSAPLYQQAFRWFRDNHDLHVQIRKENYFQQSNYEYYHFDISKGQETDITKQEDLLNEIFDDSSQDILGNYLNDEIYRKLIFEREYAFKTYEEVESFCLDKLIEIVKSL